MMTIAKLSRCLREHYHTDDFVRHELKKIKEEGDYPLNNYKVSEDILNHRPWNQAFLDELDGCVLCGATSEEMFLYMAKVSRRVHIKEMIAAVAAAVAIIAAIILLVARAVKS